MNFNNRYFWTVATLITFVYFCYTLLKPDFSYRLDNETLANTVDAVVTKLVVHQYDQNGQLQHLLYTPQLQHIPQNNTHKLQTPHIELIDANKSNWQIDAARALAINGGKKITFYGNVLVHEDEKENSMQTEQLTYFTEKKLAITSLPVVFKQPGSIVHSNGMRAYLAKKNILLSQAHAKFNPTPKKNS